jgi:cell division protein FtsN
MTHRLNKTHKQRGGMILGIIIGVLVGLAVALAVAMYVMKVPTPFNSKSTSRTPAQDAAETKKNKDWDPNAMLSGKSVAKPAEEAAPVVKLKTETSIQSTPTASPQAAPVAAPSPPPAAAIDPAIEYFVQVGAFRSNDDAQAMRGKLALAGFEGKIAEREQSGRTVFRVRTGPYDKAGGDKAKEKLEAAGFETIVVRSQK